MMQEYSKAILFDYSYKYFYEDGFGKDFDVLNLRSTSKALDDRDVAVLLGFHREPRIRFSHIGEMISTPNFRTGPARSEIFMRISIMR
jgi:hypothetical protein